MKTLYYALQFQGVQPKSLTNWTFWYVNSLLFKSIS